MPTVRRYKDKPGLYVRATHDGLITTYQVTEAGCQRLEQLGRGKGGKISWDIFYQLKAEGFLHTGGGGPGEIDGDPGYAEQPSIENRGAGALGCVALVFAALVACAGYWAISSVLVWVQGWSSSVWWALGIAAYLLVPTVVIGVGGRSILGALICFIILALTIVVPASAYFIVMWILSWSLSVWLALILGVIVFAAVWSILAVLSSWQQH